MALWTCFLSLLLLLTTATRAELIQHIAAAELVDSGHAIPHDRCSIDFFHHNESYTEDDDETHKQYRFNASDAYFFLSWTTLNDDKHSEIVGNIYNVRNPYLPIGDLNNSFLPILSHNNAQSYNQNYHYISTSDFQSKPNDIVFSFYNENSIQIRVFGATKSHFNRDSFLWSPQIPIMGKKINDSKYDIIHQNIQCIDGNTTEFIIFVYESKYWINNTEYSNIYKSSFNNKYVVSNDKNPINNIRGSMSYPLVYQSSLSQNVIIAYIANHASIAYKLYAIDGNDKLVQFGTESVIVSVATPKTIKYYNIIPLSVGGYMLMYTSNHNAIYILLMAENGDKLFTDTLIGYESNNTDSHGQIIELSQISDTETYVFITFDIFEGNTHKLVAVVYHININADTFVHVIGGDTIELNSFPDIDIDEDAVHPNFICANYDIKSKMIVVGWISNYHQFVYKPFYFHLPVNGILSTELGNIYYKLPLGNVNGFDPVTSDPFAYCIEVKDGKCYIKMYAPDKQGKEIGIGDKISINDLWTFEFRMDRKYCLVYRNDILVMNRKYFKQIPNAVCPIISNSRHKNGCTVHVTAGKCKRVDSN